MNAFELKIPDSLQAAVELLDPEDPSVRVIAGGTALMLMMKADVFRPTRLISLRAIEKDFATLSATPDGGFRIGAMATLSEIERAPELSRLAPVIRQTMRTLSNVRVRNVATLGGNLAHGDPHMDLPPVLVALGAEVAATGPNRERRIPVEELHTGYYETVLAGDELITEIVVPPQQQRRATYLKCTTRAAHDWPALGVAVSVDLDGDVARDPRIVVSAVNERPLRVPAAEAAINGRPLSADTMREAGTAAADTIETIADERGSAAYKTLLVRVYVERALRAVAGQTAEVSQ
jgi:carbon-monoxide dehydrogenase medium subunit